eukprot:5629033-Prymnesium_polylepis.3
MRQGRISDASSSSNDSRPGPSQIAEQSIASGTLRGSHSRAWFIIDPRNNVAIMAWDVVTGTALVFTATVTPYEVGFIRTSNVDALFIVNRLLDGLFTVDVVLQFVLMYNSGRGQWIDHPGEIARQYIKVAPITVTKRTHCTRPTQKRAQRRAACEAVQRGERAEAPQRELLQRAAHPHIPIPMSVVCLPPPPQGWFAIDVLSIAVSTFDILAVADSVSSVDG